MTIKKVSSVPYPIRVKEGIQHVMSFTAVVKKPIGPSSLSLSIKKKLGFFYAFVPCIKKVGSW